MRLWRPGHIEFTVLIKTAQAVISRPVKIIEQFRCFFAVLLAQGSYQFVKALPCIGNILLPFVPF